MLLKPTHLLLEMLRLDTDAISYKLYNTVVIRALDGDTLQMTTT